MAYNNLGPTWKLILKLFLLTMTVFYFGVLYFITSLNPKTLSFERFEINLLGLLLFFFAWLLTVIPAIEHILGFKLFSIVSEINIGKHIFNIVLILIALYFNIAPKFQDLEGGIWPFFLGFGIVALAMYALTEMTVSEIIKIS